MKRLLRRIFSGVGGSHSRLGRLLIALRTLLMRPVKLRVRGRSNAVSYKDSLLSRVLIDIEGHDNRIVIDPGCQLSNISFIVRGDSHYVHIHRNCVITGSAVFVLEDNECSIEIGEDTTLGEVEIAVTEGTRVSVGADCMLAYDIEIRTGDSHAILDCATRERLNHAADVTIDDHVWIGAGVKVLKGVHLPTGTVVATGSVVTKAFDEPGTILAGIPASVTRSGVTWTRERSAV